MNLQEQEPMRLPDLLGQELAHRLESEIVRLRLAPESKLVEKDICRRFRVSRSPVREALQVLASHGLVERMPRRGMFVTPMTIARLDEIYACRIPLEGLAAASVARQASAALMANLRTLVDDMARAERKNRWDAAFDANVAFTDLLHAHCGNETLQRILLSLDSQALRYRFYCYRENHNIVAADVEANALLIRAIDEKAHERASAITETLVTASWGMIRGALARRTAQDRDAAA